MLLPNLLSLTFFTLSLPSTLATCTNFTANRQHSGDTSFTIPTSQTLRVSAAIDCSDPSTFDPSTLEGSAGTFQSTCNATQCQLYTPDNYHVRVNRTLNITTSDVRVADGIFELIDSLGYFQVRDTTNLNRSWVYPITMVSTCLNKGMAGWWGFTPTLRCVDGVLSGCNTNDGDPADGTSVSACGVEMLLNGIVDGTLAVVQTTLDENSAAPPNATLTDQDQASSNDGSANEAGGLQWSAAAAVVSMVALGFGMIL